MDPEEEKEADHQDRPGKDVVGPGTAGPGTEGGPTVTHTRSPAPSPSGRAGGQKAGTAVGRQMVFKSLGALVAVRRQGPPDAFPRQRCE